MKFRLKGFTLIELIVVIAVIGILTTAFIAFIDPVTQLKKARDLRRKSDINQIQTFLEQYRHDQSYYPSPVSAGTSNWLGQSGDTCANGTPPKLVSLATDPIPNFTYMAIIPCDPLGAATAYNSGNYYYSVDSNGNYKLAACLEWTNDTSGVADASLPSGCASNLFYEVTNP